MSFGDYLKLDRLSASGAKSLLKAPAIFKWQQDHPFEPTAAMQLGTLAHRLVLERDAGEYEVIEGGRGKAEREAVVRSEGLIPVTQDVWNAAHTMAAAVDAHPLASALLSEGAPEQTILWEQDGVPMKARLDWLAADRVVDLKTTTSANPDDFRRSIATFGYHVQQAVYEAAFAAMYRTAPRFTFVAVESKAPYLVSVIELDEEAVDRGRVLMNRAVDLYRECTASGEWSGYNAVNSVSLPQWALFDQDEEEIVI